MKYAISTDNSKVSHHFGHCPFFTLIDVADGEIKNKEIIKNPGHTPGFIPRFLKDKGAQCIIAGGMGKRAVQMFEGFGISTILGISEDIDSVCSKILDGTLKGGESLCTGSHGHQHGDKCRSHEGLGHGHGHGRCNH